MRHYRVTVVLKNQRYFYSIFAQSITEAARTTRHWNSVIVERIK